MSEIKGPDGFVCAENEADYPIHVILNEYLLACASKERKAIQPDSPMLRSDLFGRSDDEVTKEVVARLTDALGKARLDDVPAAIHRRISATARPVETIETLGWHGDLANLLRSLPPMPKRGKYVITERGLLDMLAANRKSRALYSMEVWRDVVEFLGSNDLTPALCEELRLLQAELPKMRKISYVNQPSLAAAHQNVHLLRWHDEWDTLDPVRCWSEKVRRDYRAMTGERRNQWKALLHHIGVVSRSRPYPKWAAQAQKLLTDVGIEDFRDRIRDWFSPFRSGEPLPCTYGGGHVLKGLVWYCSRAEDPAVTEAALWTLEATWKTKRDNPGLSGVVTVLETLPPRDLWDRALRWREKNVLIGDELILKTAAALGISEQEARDRKLLFEPAPTRESVEETMEAFDAAAARLKRQGSSDPAAA